MWTSRTHTIRDGRGDPRDSVHPFSVGLGRTLVRMRDGLGLRLGLGLGNDGGRILGALGCRAV